jgi:hypothetical protein
MQSTLITNATLRSQQLQISLPSLSTTSLVNLFLSTSTLLNNTTSTTHIERKLVGKARHQNWNGDDLDFLFGFLERVPPLCIKDWQTISTLYNNEYAFKTGRSARNKRGLLEKFDVLCKGALTGAGNLSERQQRARNIQKRIYKEQRIRRVIDQLTNVDSNTFFDLEPDDLDESITKVEALAIKKKQNIGDFAKKRMLESASTSECEK